GSAMLSHYNQERNTILEAELGLNDFVNLQYLLVYGAGQLSKKLTSIIREIKCFSLGDIKAAAKKLQKENLEY
ncbi:29517_t:CDS:2, partial [Gigaspora margarita]